MNRKAFSLLEVLIVVAAIGTLASIAFVTMGDVVTKSRDKKLVSDTDTINRAITVYLASGGSLDGVESPAAVLKKLKTKVSTAAAARMPGMSSRVIDARLTFVPSDDETGIIWDSTAQRFVTGKGKDAIKKFILDDSLAEVAPEEDDRATSMKYASTSSWIWDYEDVALPSAASGPTVMPVANQPVVPVLAAPASYIPPASPSTPPPATGTLDPPAYSIPGGGYLINNYDLTLSLRNPNPSGSSKVVYAIDYGAWSDYTSTLMVPPGSTVSAQTVPLTPEWESSTKLDQSYEARPLRLSSPVILPSKDGFGLFIKANIKVDLANPNEAGTSTTRYRLDGGPWIDFTRPFQLKSNEYPNGVVVEAQAISSGSPYYLDSAAVRRLLPVSSLNLSGNVTGSFHDPTGQSGMVSNLSSGDSNSYFEWGNGDGNGRSKSTLDFTGGSFNGLSSGERFQIGSLNYYNGTIQSGTGADTIDFNVGLTLDINGNIFNPLFDFSFDLENTANTNDPNNPWPDADFVYLDDARASRTLIINDIEFEFRIEFGETTADGFASVDEFHVLENRDAFTNLYGTFIELGPVGSSNVDNENIVDISGSNSSDTTPVPVDEQVAYQKDGYVDPEQGAKSITTELKGLKNETAKEADTAEEAAGKAEKLLKETNDKVAKNDLSGAREKADGAQSESDKAQTATTNAGYAARKAKTLATEADSLARLDASAEKEAAKAIIVATEVIGEYERASAAAQIAASAAASADIAASRVNDQSGNNQSGNNNP